MVSVLHVMARMRPSGTERQLVGMLRAAHGSLWDATLVVLYPGFDLVDEVRSAGVPVVELDAADRLHAGRAVRLRRLMSANRYDVVHTSLWGAGAFGRAVAATLGPRRPAVVYAERRVEDFRSGAARAVDRTLRPVTDRYVANSAAVAAFVARAHGVAPDRIDVIRNGIDGSVFHPGPRAGDRSAGAPAVIGSVGRLHPQKGYDVLLAALPAVLREHAVRVVIAGEGEERDSLQAAAAGLPVTFAGHLATPEEVADFLRSLDLFVLPSRYEGLPNALLEAVACGVPAVATDAPGIADAVRHGVALVPPDDPQALAQGIITAIGQASQDVPAPDIPTFHEVALAHRETFVRAMAHRRGVPRS